MQTGIVKWFNNAKGYGFILPETGDNDIFAHFSAITMDGYKTLKAGQEVTFDIIEGEKGLHATNIVPSAKASASRDRVLRSLEEIEELIRDDRLRRGSDR